MRQILYGIVASQPFTIKKFKWGGYTPIQEIKSEENGLKVLRLDNSPKNDNVQNGYVAMEFGEAPRLFTHHLRSRNANADILQGIVWMVIVG